VLLVGARDFTFGRPPVGDNAVRTVYSASWWREMLVFRVGANAFLYRTVRLVGARWAT
jgi:tRNA U38,U39,U40 pseudouridine synthase TruA